MIVAPCQIRMARAALGWSLSETASRSKLSLSTIRRSELEDTFMVMTIINREALERTFMNAGIRFTGDASSPGVQLVLKPR